MNQVRRMTLRELAGACWECWMWGALMGANLGYVIGEMLTQGRWWFVLISATGALCSYPQLAGAHKRSSGRIAAFYREQLGGWE